MAWLESHQTLAEHPKRKRLSRLLGTSKAATIGHLHLVWWWAMDYAQDGDLSRYTDDDLADAGGWEGDAIQFVDALIESGFLSEERQVHDWDDYAGRLIEKREANAKRMRDARAKKDKPSRDARSQNVQRTCDERAAHVQGLHNQTQPNMTTPPKPPTGGESVPVDSAVSIQGAPLDDEINQALQPANLFPGEFAILEGEFLGPKLKAFWQLYGEGRAKLLGWLAFSKEERQMAYEWALGEEWAQNPFGAAFKALQYPAKFRTFPGNKVVQLRREAERTVPAEVAGRPWEDLYRRLKWTPSGVEAEDWQVAFLAAAECGLDPAEAQRRAAGEGIAQALAWVWKNRKEVAHG